MNYYLVDFENTGENGLRGIEDLGAEDRVVIFYNINSDKISFAMHRTLMECRAEVAFQRVNTGKRLAIDFQLSTYIGFLVGQSDTDTYYIISKNYNYASIIGFWRNANIFQADRIQNVQKGGKKSIAADEELQYAIEEDAAGEDAESTETPEAMAEETAEETAEYVTEEAVREAGDSEENADPAEEAEESAQEPAGKTAGEPAEEIRVESAEDAAQADTLPVETEKAEAAAPSQEEEPKPAKKKGRRGQRKSKQQAEAENDPNAELEKAVAELIGKMADPKEIAGLIVHYKTKQGVNNAIVKKHGTSLAGEIYRAVKPLLKDKKGKND